MHQRTRQLSWVVLGALLAIGLAAIVGRFLYPTNLGGVLDPVRTRILALAGITDPLIAQRPADVLSFDANFRNHRTITRLHLVAGAMFFLLLPFQLSARSRRGRRWHRVSGRVMLGAGAMLAASALFFSVITPWAGTMETLGVTLATLWFLFAGITAWRAIRRGDILHHREWMLRAIAMPVGVVVIRLVGGVLDFYMLPLALGPRTLFWISVWVGLGLSAAVMEGWVRSTRVRPAQMGGLSSMFAPSRTSMQYPRARS